MQIQNYLTLILFMISSMVFADVGDQTFATKGECLRFYVTSSGSNNVVSGEAYCKDKIGKSAVDICADKKLLDFNLLIYFTIILLS